MSFIGVDLGIPVPPPDVTLDDGTVVDFARGNTENLCAWLTAEGFGQFREIMVAKEVDWEEFYYSTADEMKGWGCFEAKVGGACRSKVRVANKASSGAALKGAVVTSKGAPVTRRKASSRLSPAKAAALCDEANTGEPEAPTLRR